MTNVERAAAGKRPANYGGNQFGARAPGVIPGATCQFFLLRLGNNIVSNQPSFRIRERRRPTFNPIGDEFSHTIKARPIVSPRL